MTTAEGVPLGNLLERPATYGIVKAGAFQRDGVPMVRGGDIRPGRILRNLPRVSHEKSREFSRTVLQEGDVVVALVGYPGNSAVVPAELVGANISRAVGLLRPGPLIEPAFLAHFLNSPEGRREFLKPSAGSAQLVVNLADLNKLHVTLPRQEEQRAVVAMLDSVDNLNGTLEQLLAKKQAVQQGMMQQLLTGRTRLPGFSEPWTDVRLGDHVQYLKSVALSRAQLNTSSPTRYLHYGDIHTSAGIRLAAATDPMPRAAQHLIGTAGSLQVGDLVFADASEDPDGVGKSVEITSVPTDGAIPGLHTIAARFDKNVLADGFKAYLQFVPWFRESLLRLAAGTKVLATTHAYISSIALPLPSVEEQRSIADTLIDCDVEIEALGRRLEKGRSVKRGMMQQLLAGQTRLPVGAAE